MAHTVDWSEYYRAMLTKPLHPTYAQLDAHLPAGPDPCRPPLAVELGCGVGHGVLHLLERGYRVIAVDGEPEALDIVRSRLPSGADVELVRSRIEDYGPPTCDLLVAGFSLFFLATADFDRAWARITAAIRPGGLFMGEFLGVNDEWAARGYTVHSRAEVERLLAPFDVLFIEEAERDGSTAMGTPKHWHIFHVVARKLPLPAGGEGSGLPDGSLDGGGESQRPTS